MLLVYLPFFILAALTIFFGLPYLWEESRKLMVELPRLLDERIFIPLEKYISMDGIRAMLPGGEPAPGGAEPVITSVPAAATFVASSIAVLFIVFYMLIDAERIKADPAPGLAGAIRIWLVANALTK